MSRSHLPFLDLGGICWNKLWKLNLPERLKMHLWRIGVNSIPTKENLLTRLHVSDTNCLFCKDSIEFSSHLFFNCLAFRSFWFAVCWGLRIENLAISQPQDIIKLILNPPNFPCENVDNGQISLRLAFTIEEIWMARNRSLHQNCVWDVSSSIRLVQTRCHEFSTIITPLQLTVFLYLWVFGPLHPPTALRST